MESRAELFTGTYWDQAHEVHDKLLRGDRRPVRAVLPGLAPVWVIIGDEQARAALEDERLGKDSALIQAALRERAADAGLPVPQDLSRMFGDSVLFRDGERRAEQRRLLTGAFTARRVRELQPRIEEITDDLLAGMTESGDSVVDLVEHLAGPLPLTVICELVGIPQVDRARFRELTIALMEDDPAVTLPASDELAAFFGSLITAKRAAVDRGQPGLDLTTALLAADDQQLIDILFLLFVAGHETTVNLIGNTALALLRHPPLWRRVAERPELAHRAVEETLRWDSPVRTATHRVTLEPVVYGDVEIPAGELVMVCIDSANRDAARWPDPGRFDMSRDTRGHLAFGYGVHACLGAPLGRAEAEIAIRKATSRFPDARLDGSVLRLRRHRSTIMNGLESLPVALTA
ncbi:Cytochrome P450 107B1 (plasmid) [Actinosynnema sp. ALI-1.44]